MKPIPSALACLSLFGSAVLLQKAGTPQLSSAPGANSCPRSLNALCVSAPGAQVAPDHPHFYLGFDRNTYPGDSSLPILRKTFAHTSYWLSPPPGEKTNTWLGKRELLRSQGSAFWFFTAARKAANSRAHGRSASTTPVNSKLKPGKGEPPTRASPKPPQKKKAFLRTP